MEINLSSGLSDPMFETGPFHEFYETKSGYCLSLSFMKLILKVMLIGRVGDCDFVESGDECYLLRMI